MIVVYTFTLLVGLTFHFRNGQTKKISAFSPLSVIPRKSHILSASSVENFVTFLSFFAYACCEMFKAFSATSLSLNPRFMVSAFSRFTLTNIPPPLFRFWNDFIIFSSYLFVNPFLKLFENNFKNNVANMKPLVYNIFARKRRRLFRHPTRGGVCLEYIICFAIVIMIIILSIKK